MDPRVTRIIITVAMATYLLLLTTCNGQYDADQRYRSPLDSYAVRGRTQYDKNFLRLLYRHIDRVRRNHQHMTDAGYGSRVQAGSKLANALIAQHIYGAFGPGRRKRSSDRQQQTVANQIPF